MSGRSPTEIHAPYTDPLSGEGEPEMLEFRDTRSNLRCSGRVRRRGLRLALLLSSCVVTVALALRSPAHAETINVPCDVAALAAAMVTANTNGEEDFLWLAPLCSYVVTVTWVVEPDSGNPLWVFGRGATLRGEDLHTVLVVDPGATLHLADTIVTDGASTNPGGAILNVGTLHLTDVTVSSSSAGQTQGGGIYNVGVARLTRTTVSDNTASSGGGGIANVAPGRLTLIASTVSGNAGLYGGGIQNAARAALFDSTLFGNGGFIGGGILNTNKGTAQLSNVTISGNSVSGGSGSSLWNDGSLAIDNSIVANISQGAECTNQGTITNSTSNLIEDGSCGLVGTTTGDPKLGVPTGTPAVLPLLAGSPAIDAGQNPHCSGVDQRGAPRPQDANQDGFLICDLGAYEASPPTADADGDGAPDETDNCPFIPNADQVDRGGVGSNSDPDGIGDACQCGDVNGSGRVTLSDATLVLRALLVPPAATLAKPELCNVVGSAACTSSDAAVIRRALLVPPTATIGSACGIPAN